jgi:hypothetical protein
MNIRDWYLESPVPPAGTPEFDEWTRQVRDLGEVAAPELLALLSNGDEGLQDSALIALRQIGIHAEASGFGETFHYLVQLPNDDVRRVTPLIRTGDRQAAKPRGKGSKTSVEFGYEFSNRPPTELDIRLDLFTVLVGKHGIGDVRADGSLASGRIVVSLTVKAQETSEAAQKVILAVETSIAMAGLRGFGKTPLRIAS